MVRTTRFIIDRSVLHNGVTLKIPLMIQIPPISNPYFKLCGSGKRSVITVEVCRIVEKQMRRDDETTDSQLYVHLTSLGYTLNLRTILCCQTSLGWTFRGSAYRYHGRPSVCQHLTADIASYCPQCVPRWPSLYAG